MTIEFSSHDSSPDQIYQIFVFLIIHLGYLLGLTSDWSRLCSESYQLGEEYAGQTTAVGRSW